MSLSTRRAAVVVLGFFGLVSFLTIWQVHAQVGAPVARPIVKPIGGPVGPGPVNPPTAADDGYNAGGLELVTDSNLRKKMQAARDYIREEKWTEACRLLQNLIDSKQDAFVKREVKQEDGKPTISPWVSVRAEANRVLGTLPPDGLKFYQQVYGPDAEEVLKHAQDNSDRRELARVAECFLHTEAGAEANVHLGTLMLDRGEFTFAALYFERLLNREGNDKLSEEVLVRAALSFRMVGDYDKEEQVWKKLAARGDSVTMGENEKVSLDDLRKEFDQYSRGTVAIAQSGSPVYRGNAARNYQGIGGRAFLECLWKQDMSRETPTKNWLADGMEKQRARNLPVLPAFFPVAANVDSNGESVPVVVYRSYFGVHAVDIHTGKLKWESDSHWSLDKMVRDHKKLAHISQWMTNWLNTGGQSILWENSVTGTLSTDGKLVYLVEDLQVPPFGQANPYGGFQPPYGGYPDPDINQAVMHSELHAYDLKTGKIVWHLGGLGEKKDDPANEVRDTYFLGPPLPLGGKLYVLTEKNQELRLVCLDPTKDPAKGEAPVVWVQALGSTRDNKLSFDVGRRIQAAHLSCGEGILVCPTNAGAVFGVDLLTHSLVWARPYRPKVDVADPTGGGFKGVPPGGFNPGGMPGKPTPNDWKTSAPVLVDGKVVFTAPDGNEIYCLNLKDGAPLWMANRTDDDLYLAGVFSGKVVIVTKKSVRSLNLSDGQPGWHEIETGVPSGQGIASDNIYYLPLKSAAMSKKPEICAIDIERGAIVAHTTHKNEMPGNLLFFDGRVLSQTATEIVAYPQLKVKLDLIDKAIAKNPNDPAGRFERGDLRLSEGNLDGAIEDLQTALDVNNKPEPAIVSKARAKLHEALSELVQSYIQKKDFASAEKYLKTFEEVSKVDDADLEPAPRVAEQNRRLGIYLCLLGKGREQQGRLVDAFEAYSRYGSLANEELMTSLDEPSVKANPQVWARGRINAMIAHAQAEQRKPLEDLIESKWQQLKSNPDTLALADFVGKFGIQFHAGREARMTLAERLMDQEGSAQLLQAESNLLQVARQQQDRPMAARATEVLAKTLIRKGYLEDATYYYNILGHEFADVTVRDGKTGSDLWNELATDKRLLPYLAGAGQVWSAGKVKALPPEHGNYVRQQRLFIFEVEGDQLPYYLKNRLALNLDYHNFRVVERATGEEKWNKNLTRTQFAQYVMQNNQGIQGGNQNAQARFPAHTLGHLVVLPLGHLIFGIDPINKEVLWEKNLLGASNNQLQANVAIGPDGSLQIFYQDGYTQRLGNMGPLSPGYLCLQTRDGLVAIDPFSSGGKVLWTRTDITGNCRIFGDEETIFVVEIKADGKASTSRAIRAQDGVNLDLPNFADAYQNRVRTFGHNILVKEQAGGGLVLRLYDVNAGKDVWKKTFPAGSTMLRSDDPDICGVIEPEGKVAVFDVRTEKELLKAVVDPKHVDKALIVNLLQDQNLFYLAIQQPNDPAVNPFGGPWVNLMVDTGTRQLPLNGWFYAFEKSTGKLKWRNETQQQMLLMEEYKDLPILVFTSRYNKPIGAGGRFGNQQVMAVKTIDKHTGKRLFDEPEMLNGPQFHSYTIDPRAGKIELIAPNYKITHTIETVAPMGEKTGKIDSGSGSTGTVDPQVERLRTRQQLIEQYQLQLGR